MIAYSFDAQVKRNRVFVLGAGFSHAAGVPLTEELLACAMSKFSSECPGIYSRVKSYAKTSTGSTDEHFDLSKVKFSDLCTFLEFIELREYGGGEKWSDNGSREKLALRFYLAKTLVERTPAAGSIPQLYIDFAKQLHGGDIVISLNWDGLLELALQAVGKNYTYNFADECSIKLCKLHGSVNWRLGEPDCLGESKDPLGWQSLNCTKGMMAREIYHSSAPLHFATWGRHAPLGELDPFLVLPGYGKAFDVRSNAVFWYRPEFAFATTHDVYIIGLGLARDDFFVRSLFLYILPYIDGVSGVNGRRIFIINPGESIGEDYDFVLRLGYADLIPEPFSPKHVDLITQRLSHAFS